MSRTTRDQLIAQLQYAIGRERYSQFRYREAAKLALNDGLRRLLESLVNEEAGHEKKLRRALEKLKGAATEGQA